MTALATLGPSEVLAALRDVSTVLSEHAAALDRLDLGRGWDEGGTHDGSEAPDVPLGGALGPGAGSDLAGVLTSGVERAEGSTSLGTLVERFAAGAVEGAAGTAGRAVAKAFAGMAEALGNADQLDAERFAIGLELAAERLATRDDGSHAGCLPAVVAASADGALAALDTGADLAEVVVAAADDGLVELENGPVANPRLSERGVVDAGAAGFLLMLDVLASVVTGEPLPAPPLDPIGEPSGGSAVPSTHYRVTCRVEPAERADLETANWLESLWFELGEIERFEAFGESWELAVLTGDPGAAVEALFEVGRPRELRIAAVAPTT